MKTVEITNEKQGDIHFIYVEGEVDAGSSIHLDNVLKEVKKNNASKLAVDLSKLKYISSAGLGVFVSYLDEFEQKKVKFVIYGIRDTVRQVFDILGLEKIITIKSDREEAISALNE